MISIPESAAYCAICKEIMHDPTSLGCSCSRSFCFTCINTWLAKTNYCPLCKGKVTDQTIFNRGPAEWRDALDSIKRSCPNNPKCRYRRGVYHEAKHHAEQECAFRKVPCPNEECDEILEQRHLKDHLRLCLLKRCKNFRLPRFGCKMMGTADAVRQHEIRCCFSEPEVLKQIEELSELLKK